jgi:hypothetical protein
MPASAWLFPLAVLVIVVALALTLSLVLSANGRTPSQGSGSNSSESSEPWPTEYTGNLTIPCDVEAFQSRAVCGTAAETFEVTPVFESGDGAMVKPASTAHTASYTLPYTLDNIPTDFLSLAFVYRDLPESETDPQGVFTPPYPGMSSSYVPVLGKEFVFGVVVNATAQPLRVRVADGATVVAPGTDGVEGSDPVETFFLANVRPNTWLTLDSVDHILWPMEIESLDVSRKLQILLPLEPEDLGETEYFLKGTGFNATAWGDGTGILEATLPSTSVVQYPKVSGSGLAVEVSTTTGEMWETTIVLTVTEATASTLPSAWPWDTAALDWVTGTFEVT